MARAGLNAFVVSLIGLTIALAFISLWPGIILASLFIALIYIAVILTFVISFNNYEKRGEIK